MSEKLILADQIDRQAKIFQAFIDSAKLLREIGQLEVVAEEAKRAAAAAEAEAKEAKAEAKEAKEDAKKAKDKVAAILEAAEAQAKVLVDEAAEEAKNRGAKAQLEAEQVVAEAGLKYADILASAVAKRQALTAEISVLLEQAKAANVAMAEIEAKTKDAETRLAKAQAQIEKLLGR